ncbi:MAG: hypothetical protein HKN56_11180 [Gammaproteobacteria bacterium]|nr:hypothetical protein [Gammaproteobacteria bacterium]
MKNRIAGLAVFAVVMLGMLLIGEWVIRGLFADETVLFPRYHTDVQYGDYTLRRIRPNSRFRHASIDGSWEFVTNSQGFRNREDFSYQKPPNTFRVLSLGDSHTQGYEVRQDHTFSAVLERYLEKHLGSAQVLNTGVSGFSNAEALVLLENEGLRYDPDVVVLGFFGNDLEDNIKAGLFKLNEAGDLVPARYEHIPGVRIQNIIYSIPGVQWLSENSYFYSVLFNSTWDFFKNRLTQQASEQVAEYAVPQKTEYSNYEIALAEALLERLHQVCKDNGITLVVVDIPLLVRDGEVVSSFPDSLQEAARQHSDIFIDSKTLFSDYAGAIELQLPHGHHHISEFSHALIGVAIGEGVLRPQD